MVCGVVSISLLQRRSGFEKVSRLPGKGRLEDRFNAGFARRSLGWERGWQRSWVAGCVVRFEWSERFKRSEWCVGYFQLLSFNAGGKGRCGSVCRGLLKS